MKVKGELEVVHERFVLVEEENVIGHLGEPDQDEVITEEASSPVGLGRVDGPVSTPSTPSNTMMSDDVRFSGEWTWSLGRRGGRWSSSSSTSITS